mgnify:CR=1 FL=1
MEQMFRLQTKNETALILSTKQDAIALGKERHADIIDVITNQKVS